MTRPPYRFRLYIAGDGPHSMQAIANLQAICRDHLPGRHEIELVDVIVDARRALEDRVMLTPLLVKLSPAPTLRLIGTLSQRESVLKTLGIPGP